MLYWGLESRLTLRLCPWFHWLNLMQMRNSRRELHQQCCWWQIMSLLICVLNNFPKWPYGTACQLHLGRNLEAVGWWTCLLSDCPLCTLWEPLCISYLCLIPKIAKAAISKYSQSVDVCGVTDLWYAQSPMCFSILWKSLGPVGTLWAHSGSSLAAWPSLAFLTWFSHPRPL